MPVIPVWCTSHCPKPQENPCCFFSIRKSTKLFQIFDCILLTCYFFVALWWVFIHSKDVRYTKKIMNNTPDDECEKAILAYLNEKYYEAVEDITIEAHQRFGNTMFHINSTLRLRGYILTTVAVSFFSYSISCLFLAGTFRKSERKNRKQALRIAVCYLSFAFLAIFFSIATAVLFFVPVYSCRLSSHRIPILILTIVFAGPYKFLEMANRSAPCNRDVCGIKVTVQYLRVLRSFTYDAEVKRLANITADEPGWVVAWWRRRKLPKDYKIKLEAQIENAKLRRQQETMKQLERDEDEYRKRNRARIKRTEMSERITWMERVGRYRNKLPDPAVVGEDGSGIFSLESSVTWGTNLTTSMSRSSPDSDLSVENYMDNYEDYYDLMIRQRGGSPSEHPSVTQQRPSIFTFKTLQLNKVAPKEENQNKRANSISSTIGPTVSASSIASTNPTTKPMPSYSETQIATTVSQSSIISTTVKVETEPTNSIAAPPIQDPAPFYSTVNLPESQKNVDPGKDKPKKDKPKKDKSKKDKSKKDKQKGKSSKKKHSILSEIDKESKMPKIQLNDTEVKTEESKRPKIQPSDSEVDEESRRPKIVKGKQPKVIKKN